MAKTPKNLTLNDRVLTFAERIMQLRGFDNLTGLVETLLREEYERRHGPLNFEEMDALALNERRQGNEKKYPEPKPNADTLHETSEALEKAKRRAVVLHRRAARQAKQSKT